MMFWTILKRVGGSLAVITALLYTVGFLSVQTHLTVLGVASLVDVQPLAYLLAGATFFYSLPAFVITGLVLTLPTALIGYRLARVAPQRPVLVLSIACVTSLVALIIVVTVMIPPTGILFGADDTRVTRLYREGAEGQTWLLVTFAVYAAHVALLPLPTALWLNARKQWSMGSVFLAAELGTAVAFGLFVVLTPVMFGCYAVRLSFPRIVVNPAKEARLPKLEGWMLNRGLSADSSLVVYVGDKSGGKVVVVKKDAYESLDVLQRSYLVLPDATQGTH